MAGPPYSNIKDAAYARTEGRAVPEFKIVGNDWSADLNSLHSALVLLVVARPSNDIISNIGLVTDPFL
jgi:hypothetical protein